MNKLTSQELIEEFKKIQQNQLDIMIKKNSDYSGAMAFKNFDMVEVLGICSPEEGLLTRITDKIARASNLLHNEAKVSDESMIDTLLDASNYLILLAVYIKTSDNYKREKLIDLYKIASDIPNIKDEGEFIGSSFITKPIKVTGRQI